MTSWTNNKSPECRRFPEEEEEEGQDDDLSAPPVRGSRKEQTSGETEAGEDEIEVDDEEEDVGGQPSEAKKRRTEGRSIREQFDKMIKEASQVKFCFQCGGETQFGTMSTQRRRPDGKCFEQNENHHGGAVQIPIIVGKVEDGNSNKGKERQTSDERGHATRKTLEQDEIHRERRDCEELLATTSTTASPRTCLKSVTEKKADGVEVHRAGEGVQSRAQLDLLVERAAQESPPMIPTIRELNSVNPDNDEELQRMIQQEREQHGPNWNFRYVQPQTYGTDIGTLEIAHISGEEMWKVCGRRMEWCL